MLIPSEACLFSSLIEVIRAEVLGILKRKAFGEDRAFHAEGGQAVQGRKMTHLRKVLRGGRRVPGSMGKA